MCNQYSVIRTVRYFDPRLTLDYRVCIRSLTIEDPVFIHPGSCLAKEPTPDFVAFQELCDSESGKTYMKGVCMLCVVCCCTCVVVLWTAQWRTLFFHQAITVG